MLLRLSVRRSAPSRLAALLAAPLLSAACLVPGEAAAGHIVKIHRETTEKVCQVLGEFDRQQGRPTVNRTESRFRFWGGDLGASVEHDGKLLFLFGDTHPVPGSIWRERDADSIAVSETTNPEDCIRLSFLEDSDNGYRQLRIPGVFQGAFAVPSGGISLNGSLYVFHTSDIPGRGFAARSVLARSDNDGYSFRYLYDVSREKLVHVAPALVKPGAVPALPPHEGDGLLLWGSSEFRRGDPYLAFIPAAEIEDPAALRHFAGLDADGKPVWSADEGRSVPLFRSGCMGEFSVAWNPDIGKWVMFYTCGGARAMSFYTTADQPWGPWAEPEPLFDPAWDIKGCEFLNTKPQPAVTLDEAGRPCPVVSDPHTPFNLGESYGPYLIPRFTKGVPGRSSTVYFLMSTWNPYTVVLMRATLTVEPDRQADAQGAAPVDR